MIGFLLLALSLLFLTIASYTDIRTKEVPDELSIVYIVSALFLRLGYSLYSKDPAFFLEPLGVAALFGILAYIAFLLKQWGGGDLLIFIGIGLSFGTLPKDLLLFFSPIRGPWPFWATILVNLIFIGAIYGTLALLVIVSRKRKLRVKYFSALKAFLPFMAVVVAVFLIISAALDSFNLPFFLSLIFLLALFRFAQVVEKSIFIREIDYSELREEDWIEDSIVVQGKTIVDASTPGLSNDDVALIKNLVAEGKLSGRIRIKEGIPFIPVFPLTLLSSIVIGDIMSGLVMGAIFSAI